MRLYLLLWLLGIIAACTAPVPPCNLPTDGLGARLSDIAQSRVRDRLLRAEPADFRYFFREFRADTNGEWLIVNFRNAEECFDVKLYLPDPDTKVLAGMRRTDGASYPEELRGVRWAVRPVENYGEAVVFEGMKSVVD